MTRTKRRKVWTYPEVAAKLGVDMQPPCPAPLSDSLYRPGIVYWRDRKMTKAGLYRFLRLIAHAQHPDLANRPYWQRIYLVHQFVNDYCRVLQVRIPFQLTLTERARLKALVTHIPRHEPLRKEAFQWSRRVA